MNGRNGSRTLLDVRDLKTHFFTDAGPVRAVDGVSLSIGRGEAVGLLGESGCGKSVFARSLMRLVPPPGRTISGDIILDGENLLAKTEREMCRLRGRAMAMVFQDPFTTLNPTQRIGPQIAEALILHGIAGSARDARARVLDVMDAVRIPEPGLRYDQYPHEFSGGMRQRAIIAAALVCRPLLLICDEPTTALDVTVQAQILGLMREIRDRHDVAILFITHDIAAAGGLCDRLAVMYAGHIVETGPTHEVLKDPRHPYTKGLIGCVPSLRTRDEIRPIPGEVPNPASLPSGCRFEPRCPLRQARCALAEPPLHETGAGRHARCILCEPGAPP